MPWRETRDPYRILVSEIMLQQTQVSRVLKKYPEFIKKFPTLKSLANSSLQSVLQAWVGLGYNRRAKSLQKSAQIIMKEHKDKVPASLAELDFLPGVGKATAGAILAYAYNKPEVFIETNIRNVYIHFFFKDKKSIKDRDLLPLVKMTLLKRNPRMWYYALMDYGNMQKKLFGNANQTSAHYTKQARFKGSFREVRGKIVKILALQGKVKQENLYERINSDKRKITEAVNILIKEGLVSRKGKILAI